MLFTVEGKTDLDQPVTPVDHGAKNGAVVLQLRIFAMYNRNKTLAAVNLVFFTMEIIAMLTVYNIGIKAGTS